VNYFTKVIYNAKQFHIVDPFSSYTFYLPCICSSSLLYVRWPLAFERGNCFLSNCCSALINERLLPCAPGKALVSYWKKWVCCPLMFSQFIELR